MSSSADAVIQPPGTTCAATLLACPVEHLVERPEGLLDLTAMGPYISRCSDAAVASLHLAQRRILLRFVLLIFYLFVFYFLYFVFDIFYPGTMSPASNDEQNPKSNAEKVEARGDRKFGPQAAFHVARLRSCGAT